MWRFTGPSSFELTGVGVTVVFGVPGTYHIVASVARDRGETPLGQHLVVVSGERMVTVARAIDVASLTQQRGESLPVGGDAIASLEGEAGSGLSEVTGGEIGASGSDSPSVVGLQDADRDLEAGSWTEPYQVALGSVTLLGAGDFSGDGRADLVVADRERPEFVLFSGHGDGTFSRVGKVNLAFRPDGILVADFVGNGLADVLVINWKLGQAVLYVSSGPFGFEAPMVIGLPGGSLEAWTDHLDDRAGSELVWVTEMQRIVWSFTETGQVVEWSSAPAAVVAARVPAPPFVWADVSGDGTSELVYSSHNPGEIFVVRRGVEVEIGRMPGRVPLVQLVAADVSGDGRLDLIGLDDTGDVHVLKLGAW